MNNLGSLFYLLHIIITCINASRILIGDGGTPTTPNDGSFELIDLDNPQKSCNIKNFPAPAKEAQGWIYNDQILVCGGRSDPCLDRGCYVFRKNAWVRFEHQPERHRYDSGYVNVPNVGLWITGGYLLDEGNDWCRSHLDNSSAIFNGEEWIAGPKGNDFYHSCSVQIDPDTTFLAGGASYPYNYLYRWETQEFEIIDKIPEGGDYTSRVWPACGLDPKSGLVVLAGGERFTVSDGYSANVTNTVKLFNPETKTWTNGPDLPKALSEGVIVSLENKLIFTGGRNLETDEYNDEIFEFSKDDGWKTLEVKMKLPRACHIALNIPDNFEISCN